MNDIVIPALQDFLNTLVTGVLAVLSAFLIALVKRGFDWVSEKIDGLKDERAQKALNNAIEHLCDLVSTTVTSLQQTLGKEIRESITNNDGKYTREDLLALKDKALESIKAQLTSAMKEALSTAYTDLDAYIIDLVESEVLRMKDGFLPSGSSAKILLG